MAKKKQETTLEGKALDDLVDQCFVVADRKGRIVEKNSSPVLSYLSMKYQSDYGEISFKVTRSAMGNGSYRIEVKDCGKVLLKAYGNYTSGPYNNMAEKYVPGDWQKKLKKEYEEVI